MEKRELREAQSPILKPNSKETATPIAPAQPTPSTEERRVAFNIGDSDDVDNKDRKVTFDIGDSDDADYSESNGGEWQKTTVVSELYLVLNILHNYN